MKRHLIIIIALVLMGTMAKAGPVDEATARRLGQSFVTTCFESSRQSAELSLVYTAWSDRGEACYYIYNVGNTGFVILAADDHYRPIIAYSAEGIFNPDDMAPALAYHLEKVRQGVMLASQSSTVEPKVAADWAMLERTGRLVSRHGGREDEFLVETTWNQNSPYNYFCPEGEGGPGGHCYAGCVATAAAQLMKYWDHPVQGRGSHTYYPNDHPEYGPLTANFGETMYDWEHMANSLNGASQEEIEAVALLIYHAGVSVDMNYRPTSSGAVTGMLCETMPAYFYYTDRMANLYREEYGREEYLDMVRRSIEMGWPMVQRGGGHAYVLDGYNDNDMVHYNWGWGGSSDAWFDIDNHGYTDGESILFNYVPEAIYASTPDAPTDLQIMPSADNSLTATLSWKNPELTLTGDALATIDYVVVEREGQVVYMEENVAPGAEMSFVDETIPYIDAFAYKVYVVSEGRRGAAVESDEVYVGPTCGWRILMQSNSVQGWKGGYVSLCTATGKEIGQYTTTDSTPLSLDINVPLGRITFSWVAPHGYVSNITIIIKDGENNSVYTYTGATSGLEEGVILEMNNGCGAEMPTAPYNLSAEAGDDTVTLIWEQDGEDPDYGFFIYRDERIYAFVNDPTVRTFVDSDFSAGHCYAVSALAAGGESEQSNEFCASTGDCMAASNMDYEYVGDNYKIKLKWDRPEVSEGLSGYYLYRKQGADGTYERIKLLGHSATSYTDNTANEQGMYYYRLYAYYREIDCTSAPATAKNHPDQFYLPVYYSPTDVAEQLAFAITVYPNPADQSLKVEAEGMTHVVVYNLLGQPVFESSCEDSVLNLNVAGWSEGVYLLKVQTPHGVIAHRLSVVH